MVECVCVCVCVCVRASLVPTQFERMCVCHLHVFHVHVLRVFPVLLPFPPLSCVINDALECIINVLETDGLLISCPRFALFTFILHSSG